MNIYNIIFSSSNRGGQSVLKRNRGRDRQALCLLLLLLPGCLFFRHDIEVYHNGQLIERDSKTIWTLAKNVTTKVDPNEIQYSSESKDVELYSPYGIIKTTDPDTALPAPREDADD